MSPLTIAQLRGLKDLVQDMVSAGVDAVEETQRAIARQPFAVLKRIPGVAAPARLVEQAQDAVTVGVFQSIRAVNHLAGAAATQALNWLEEQQNAAGRDSAGAVQSPVPTAAPIPFAWKNYKSGN